MTVKKYKPEPESSLDNAIDHWQRMADQSRYTKADKTAIYYEIRSEISTVDADDDYYARCFLCDASITFECGDCKAFGKWPTTGPGSELVATCSSDNNIYLDWRKNETRETVITMLEFMKSLKSEVTKK